MLPPSCALLGGFAIGARVAFILQHNANPSYKLASIPRYDDIVRTLGGVCGARAAGRWLASDGGRSQNCAPGMGSGRGWLAGDLPSTGAFSTLLRLPGLRASTGGVLATTRTQNVSEYMLVLALCLVYTVMTRIYCLTSSPDHELRLSRGVLATSNVMYLRTAFKQRCRHHHRNINTNNGRSWIKNWLSDKNKWFSPKCSETSHD